MFKQLPPPADGPVIATGGGRSSPTQLEFISGWANLPGPPPDAPLVANGTIPPSPLDAPNPVWIQDHAEGGHTVRGEGDVIIAIIGPNGEHIWPTG